VATPSDVTLDWGAMSEHRGVTGEFAPITRTGFRP
jgi:hypothetical protein